MHTRRTMTTITTAALLAGTIVMLAGCNKGGVGIFYSLQAETKVTAPKNAYDHSAVSMALLPGSPGNYYVGTGSIYAANAVYSTIAGTSLTWNPVGTSGVTTALTFCNQVAADSSTSTLYAVFTDPNSAAPSSYLYSADGSSTVGTTKNPWTESSDTVFQGGVETLFSVNGKVFVSVLTSPTSANAGPYSFYLVSDPSTPLNATDLSGPVTGGTFDTNTSTYWFVEGNRLYSDTVSSTTGPPTSTSFSLVSSGAPSLEIGIVYRGIYYSSSLKTLFLSTNNGIIYAMKDGASSFSEIAKLSSLSLTTVSGFNGLGEVVVGTTDVILIGSDSGYFELDIPSTTAFDPASGEITLYQPGNTSDVTALTAYTTVQLATANVLGFFTDRNTSPSWVFGLSSRGLWRNESDASAARSWSIESID